MKIKTIIATTIFFILTVAYSQLSYAGIFTHEVKMDEPRHSVRKSSVAGTVFKDAAFISLEKIGENKYTVRALLINDDPLRHIKIEDEFRLELSTKYGFYNETTIEESSIVCDGESSNRLMTQSCIVTLTVIPKNPLPNDKSFDSIMLVVNHANPDGKDGYEHTATIFSGKINDVVTQMSGEYGTHIMTITNISGETIHINKSSISAGCIDIQNPSDDVISIPEGESYELIFEESDLSKSKNICKETISLTYKKDSLLWFDKKTIEIPITFEKSWWSQNWWWVVPAVIVTGVATGVIIYTLINPSILSFLVPWIFHSDGIYSTTNNIDVARFTGTITRTTDVILKYGV